MPLLKDWRFQDWRIGRAAVLGLGVRASVGLGQVDEARKLLGSSHAVLQAEFGAAYEAVGEAEYYLTLAELLSVPVPEIARLSGALRHVRSLF